MWVSFSTSLCTSPGSKAKKKKYLLQALSVVSLCVALGDCPCVFMHHVWMDWAESVKHQFECKPVFTRAATPEFLLPPSPLRERRASVHWLQQALPWNRKLLHTHTLHQRWWQSVTDNQWCVRLQIPGKKWDSAHLLRRLSSVCICINEESLWSASLQLWSVDTQQAGSSGPYCHNDHL